ncbi:cytochrome P450 [Rhizophagus clarus]|nr:cytochrome P450 [Rhizophagus clarus]
MFTTLIFATIIFYVIRFYYKYFTRLNPLPGPLPLPIIGNLKLSTFKNADKFFGELNRKYGDICEIILSGKRIIVLSNPKDFNKMFTMSTKSPYTTRFPMKDGLPEYFPATFGVSSNKDIKSWRYNRHLFVQAVMSSTYLQEVLNWTNKCFVEKESYWNDLYMINENTPRELDLNKWIVRFTNDVTAVLTFGERAYTMMAYYEVLSKEDNKKRSSEVKLVSYNTVEKSEKFIESFKTYLGGGTFFIVVPRLLRKYVPGLKGKTQKLYANREYLYNAFSELITQRRKEIENESLEETLDRKDMLSSLIISNTERDPKRNDSNSYELSMTDEQIRFNLIDAFSGSSDTTSNFTSILIYYIAKHPEVKKKIFEEIDNIFNGDITRPVSHNDIKELKYCPAVIREVSRFHPVLPMIPRYITEPDNLAGYNWPTGTQFYFNVVGILQHPSYWDDPKEFIPERFFDDQLNKDLRNLLFGFGVRNCPGYKSSMIEMQCFLCLLFRKYDVELVDPNAPLKTVIGFLTACLELPVRIKLRK